GGRCRHRPEQAVSLVEGELYLVRPEYLDGVRAVSHAYRRERREILGQYLYVYRARPVLLVFTACRLLSLPEREHDPRLLDYAVYEPGAQLLHELLCRRVYIEINHGEDASVRYGVLCQFLHFIHPATSSNVRLSIIV